MRNAFFSQVNAEGIVKESSKLSIELRDFELRNPLIAGVDINDQKMSASGAVECMTPVDLFGRDLITTQEWKMEELEEALKLAEEYKRKHHRGEPLPKSLESKIFFMVFYASSTRTRAAFEAGAALLGGHAPFIDVSTTRLGSGEAVKDVAKMYEKYGNGIGLRILDDVIDYKYGLGQATVREYARNAEVPVINMACCTYHPTQGLADLMVTRERLHKIQGKKYVVMWGYSKKLRGRCSIQEEVLIMSRFGMDVVLAYPPGFEIDPKIVNAAKENAANDCGSFEISHDFKSAIKGANAVFPRNWASAKLLEAGASKFGVEKEVSLHNKYNDWLLTPELVDSMDKNAIVTHVLPVFRGEEATDAVMDGPHSVIYDQAEDGLYTKMAVLALTMSKNPRG
jgi:ornithine carbamoyltransferase